MTFLKVIIILYNIIRIICLLFYSLYNCWFSVQKKDEGDLINNEIFNSKKMTNKLVQQIQDPLVLSSSALPSWCEHMNLSYSFLFPFETRHLYFNCTAFGPSR
jgi:hypothetical protein